MGGGREREDNNGGERSSFPLETQEVGVGHRRGSAFYRLASGTSRPGSALVGDSED